MAGRRRKNSYPDAPLAPCPICGHPHHMAICGFEDYVPAEHEYGPPCICGTPVDE